MIRDGLNLADNALMCTVSDKVYDRRKDRIGTVIKLGQSGNYGLIYVDFNDGSKPVRVNPMNDAQCFGRFYKILGMKEERGK